MKSLYRVFLWIVFSSKMIGSVRICLPLCAPLVKQTRLTCCLSALPLALRMLRVSRKEHMVRQTLKSPGGSPRGAVAPRTPSCARSRSVLNKEQGQTPLLAEHDRDSGLALLRELFGSRPHELIRLIATSIKLRPCY